jgi:hypothetical protein
MSEYPPVLVTVCCDPEYGKAKEDISAQPSVPGMITRPHHIPASATPAPIALLSARDKYRKSTGMLSLAPKQKNGKLL